MKKNYLFRINQQAILNPVTLDEASTRQFLGLPQINDALRCVWMCGWEAGAEKTARISELDNAFQRCISDNRFISIMSLPKTRLPCSRKPQVHVKYHKGETDAVWGQSSMSLAPHCLQEQSGRSSPILFYPFIINYLWYINCSNNHLVAYKGDVSKSLLLANFHVLSVVSSVVDVIPQHFYLKGVRIIIEVYLRV